MDPKAKGEFLKKISINGFSIEEKGNLLVLRPRGAEATAQIILEEVEPNVWKAVSALGQYARFARGKNRAYFETYINQWSLEAIMQSEG